MDQDRHKDLYYKIDVYKNYIYCVRRTCTGTVCCYIDVAQDPRFNNNEVKNLKFSQIEELVDLHGGCTYAGLGFPAYAAGQKRFLADDLIIGYDYGHFDDIDMTSSTMRSKISEAEAERALYAIIDSLV